jgi:protein transport protein SEC23
MVFLRLCFAKLLLLSKYMTIQRTLSRLAQAPPVFLFVVDTCLDTEGLKALRDALVVSLSLIPPYALVGLVTFGTMARAHICYFIV